MKLLSLSSFQQKNWQVSSFFTRLLLVISLSFCSSAYAAEWLSVTQSAPMHQAPSSKTTPKYIILPMTPVKMIVTLGDQVKVQDASGLIGWIDKQYLTTRRTIIVTSHVAPIRSQPSDSASVVFTAERGVVLTYLSSPAANWVQVGHSDGQSGYVASKQIWGE